MKKIAILFLFSGIICFPASILKAQMFDYKQKITPSDRGKSDRYGHSVAVYGKYAVVGAPGLREEDSLVYDPFLDTFLPVTKPFGAAFIYKRDTFGKWNEIQKIVAPVRVEGDNFGWDVAIHGKHIIVSNPNDIGVGPLDEYAGSTYIFEQGVNGFWSYKQEIEASDRKAFDKFGEAIAINKDFIAIGAFQASGNPGLVASGKVYIFKKKPNGNWEENQIIRTTDEESGDWFGFSICLSADRLAVGAPFEDENTLDVDSIMDAGSVYIFKLDAANKWVQEQKIVASDREKEDIFGMSLTLDSNYLAVGAPMEEDLDFNAFDQKGAVYMFKKNSSNIWTETQKIVSKDRSPKDLFGFDLDLHDSFLAVGSFAEDHDANGNNFLSSSGSAYLFKLGQQEKWQQQRKYTAPIRQVEDNFGWSVSLHKDYLFFGAYMEDHNSFERDSISAAGSVYIFEHCPDGFYEIYDTTCLTYTSPSGNYKWLTSGVYQDTISTVRGCDSFITVYLTVQSQKTRDTVTLTICDSLVSPSGKHIWRTSQTYLDTLPNRFGCDSILEFRLTVLRSTYSQVYLTACDSIVSPSGRYTWKTNGLYTDTLLNAVGCDSIISVHLRIMDKSTLKLKLSDTATCLRGNAITFSDTFPQIQGTTYQWTFSDGDTSSKNPIQKSFISPGRYQAICIITDSFCTDTFSAGITIFEHPEGFVSNKTRDTQCLDNNLYTFEPSISGGKAPYTYEWIIDGSTNSPSFQYNYPKIDTVQLISQDQNGCKDTTLYIVNVDPCGLKIRAYNTFTPGTRDGKNDFFDIDVEYHDIYDLHIYNRNGSLVFESKDADTDWNGQLFNNGPEVAQGTYYYFLRYGTTNVSKSVSGTLLLIR